MITWNKDWIQKHESIWGIFEKIKFANRINGKELFYFFTENKKVNYTNSSVKYKSFSYIKSFAKEKLSEILNLDIIDLKEKNDELFKSPFSNLALLNNNLCFCRKCISTGYHSTLHQYLFIANCPFHPEEQLTDKCPNCTKDFRGFDLGYNEQGFCCKNCEFNILNTKEFYIIKEEWIHSKKIIDKNTLQLLNNIYSTNIGAQFIFSTYIETAAVNNPIYKLINMLIIDVLDQRKSIPVVIDKRYKFSPAYVIKDDENYKVGYAHRELLRNHQRNNMLEPDTILKISKFNTSNDINYLNKFLDYELFNRSKAILKSVDRYIQTKIKRKINLQKEMKKDSITDPFIQAYIDWKVTCYGVNQTPYKVYNYLGVDEPSFTFRYPFTFYQTEIYPSLLNINEFNHIIRGYKNKGYSFKLIANVFSKVLFNFLYLNFQQFLCNSLNSKIKYSQLDNSPPFIQLLKRDNNGVIVEVSFINSFELFNPNFSMIDNPLLQWKKNL